MYQQNVGVSEITMDKGVKESINKFEFKKEFREVKLKTRQSFREDQAALERRLSKYRVSGSPKKSGISDREIKHTRTNDGHKKEPVSALESIVMDVTCEGDGDTTVNSVDNSSSRTNEIELSNGGPKSHAQNGHANGHVNKRSDSGSESTEAHIGNGVIPTGKPPASAHVHGNGSASRGLATPELKTAAGRRLLGIYEKNPRLTAASTDHLDNISLRGYKHHSSHGSKIAVDQRHQVVPVPSVLGAEVTCIPGDGNLASFSVEEMVTVFRMLHVQEEAIYKLNRGKVDGKRFSRFSDKELFDIGILNPIIRYFRDRSQAVSKTIRKTAFML